MNRYAFNFAPFMLANYVGKRDSNPGDDCDFFENGLKMSNADCDTDGHYMCDYCIHNKHQNKEIYKLAKKTGLYT